MPPLDFSSLPHDDAPPGATTEPPPYALTCETCGTPLLYSGRGRKPRFCDEHKPARSNSGNTGRGRNADKELDQACTTLADLYDVTVLPLALLSPEAANVWSMQIDGLNSRNRTILANNRDLVRKINSAGAKGGTTAFVLSHLFAATPVALVLIGAATQRRAARRADAAASDGTTYMAQQVSDDDRPSWLRDMDADTMPDETMPPFDLDSETFHRT